METLNDRYPARANISTEQRQRQLQQLAQDIASIPDELAERAVEHWTKTSAYMPTAADIHRLATNFRGATGHDPRTIAQALAGRRNGQMDFEPGARQDIRWIVDGLGQLKLVPIDEFRALKRLAPPQAEAAE